MTAAADGARPRARWDRSRAVRIGARVVTVAALVTGVALFVFGNPPLLALLPNPIVPITHVDFDTFWRSAAALVEGTGIYDTDAKLHNLNPPVLSLLMAPLGMLDAVSAYRIFVTLTVLMVAGSVFAAARELRIGRGWTALAVLSVLASSPLHGTLALGQIYGILLVGVTAGWIAERRGHPRLAAVLYGVTVAIKPSLAPLLLLPLVQRRWPALRAGLAAATLATLAGMAAAGFSTGPQWLRMALTEPVATVLDNAALPGMAIRWGLPSLVGTLVGVALLVGTLLLFGLRTRWYGIAERSERGTSIGTSARGADPAGVAPWAVLATGLLTAPISWHNYLIVLWPGLLVVVASGRAGDTRRVVVGALLALAFIPITWSDLWAPGDPFTLVGHALYTAILLAAWLTLLRPATGPWWPDTAPRSGTGESFRSAEVPARSSG
ncbi:glycosyltransferase family 87 protein [Pseudonocardia sp. KRD291]|uniref:glycosyltransferase family 87 protein n=1 Tax=Pseudonocardia sp. KRD291 TaxID=2792007 RepID=UPI001C4A717C|nr:glycosyltransferase family 87 protein [Pseudonocardia sp. KRD291]MBW0102116.1 DUF2029 domain-containing protein [Pseudonocardia sp. KRD291]